MLIFIAIFVSELNVIKFFKRISWIANSEMDHRFLSKIFKYVSMDDF